MENKPNFHALGMYVHAKEQIDDLMAKRRELCGKIVQLMSGVDVLNAGKALGIKEVRDILDALNKIEEELGAALEQMNVNAQAANKKPYKPRYL